MISQLKGILSHKSPDGLTIDINGVGYDVTVPLTTFYRLPETGSPVILQIYTHVAEGALALFGFSDLHEKNVFKKLIGVSGIGPKLALTILSGLPVHELMEAIARDNLVKLTAINGIGRKTAERLIIELRDKLGPLSSTFAASSPAPTATGNGKTWEEALSALVNLGYHRVVAERALGQIKIRPDSSLENVLKESLGVLAR
ncbi:MAG: Holliday junction branch migration protein RuvA [Deltaproteobacteria bacterium]|nr:Holliday junction branch migration protein RuvA [Deltaproteobacteria bacterium]